MRRMYYLMEKAAGASCDTWLISLVISGNIIFTMRIFNISVRLHPGTALISSLHTMYCLRISPNTFPGITGNYAPGFLIAVSNGLLLKLLYLLMQESA